MWPVIIFLLQENYRVTVVSLPQAGKVHIQMPLGGEMRKFVVLAALAIVCLLCVTQSQATPIATVVIPDPGPSGFIYFGTGDASVTYSNVTFVQQAALSDGNFYNVGPAFSGFPAVLSSQQQSTGIANILIEFPNPTFTFSM